MKRILTIFLAILMISYPVTYSVAYANTLEEDSLYAGKLDLSEYSLEDIKDMSTSEFLELLAYFERTYDPFGTYEVSPIFNDEQETASPLWTSGEPDNTDENAGTHAILTAQALVELSEDIGTFSADLDIVGILLAISLASVLPDKDENSDIFAHHFYDPITGEGLSNTTDTAKTRANARFNTAVNYIKAGNSDKGYEYIGRTLHYVQDLAVPHHSTNKISIGPTSSHWQFEHSVEKRIEEIVQDMPSIPMGFYTGYRNKSIGDLAHEVAVSSSGYINYVDNILLMLTSKWDETEEACVFLSIRYSAVVLYEFACRAGLTLYK